VRLALYISVGLVVSCGSSIGQRPASEASLRSFLQGYVREKGLDDDRALTYSCAFVDLNGDGKEEAIVYLEGRWWSGSGGCNTLVLAHKDSSYKFIAKITITRPPIRVLNITSYGWHSIAVWVQGGGINPGYEAELRFNGKTYPSNPSTSPARPLTGKVAGDVVISPSAVGIPLYP
jgi:hypothetical protein